MTEPSDTGNGPRELSADEARRELDRAARVVNLHGTQKRVRRWDAATAQSVPIRPIDSIWPGYLLPGKITLLAGAPKGGKTHVATALAAIVTRGGEWPDGSSAGEPGDVAIWSGEDDFPELAARLRAADADLTRAHLMPGPADDAACILDPSAGLRDVDEFLAGLPRPRLLILDPLIAVLPRGADPNSAGDVRKALHALSQLAARHKCAVLGLAHYTKGSGGRDAAERIAGSGAWVQLPRVILSCSRVELAPGVHQRRLVRVAANAPGARCTGFDLEIQGVRIEATPQDGDGEELPTIETARAVIGEPLQGEPGELLAEWVAKPTLADEACRLQGAVDFLRQNLASGAMPAAQVLEAARQAGHSGRPLARAKAKLGIESFKHGHAWEWRLPDSGSGSDSSSSANAPAVSQERRQRKTKADAAPGSGDAMAEEF